MKNLINTILLTIPFTIFSQTVDYYQSCFGLYGEELRSELHELISDHTSYSYTTTKNILCDWKIVFVKEAGQSARICRTVNTMQKNIWKYQNQGSRMQIWSKFINPVWWSKSRVTVQPAEQLKRSKRSEVP